MLRNTYGVRVFDTNDLATRHLAHRPRNRSGKPTEATWQDTGHRRRRAPIHRSLFSLVSSFPRSRRKSFHAFGLLSTAESPLHVGEVTGPSDRLGLGPIRYAIDGPVTREGSVDRRCLRIVREVRVESCIVPDPSLRLRQQARFWGPFFGRVAGQKGNEPDVSQDTLEATRSSATGQKLRDTLDWLRRSWPRTFQDMA